jgi:hypothetical protein
MADHVAVVTRGGRGIGAAIARRLGPEGLAVEGKLDLLGGPPVPPEPRGPRDSLRQAEGA